MAFVLDPGGPAPKRRFARWKIFVAGILIVGACVGGWRYYEYRHEYTIADKEYEALQAFKPVPKHETGDGHDVVLTPGGDVGTVVQDGDVPVAGPPDAASTDTDVPDAGGGPEDTGGAQVEDPSVTVPDTQTGTEQPALVPLNGSYVCWIEIPGTEVDYPVAHGDDDEYYLTHTFNGTYNKCGSIFLAAGNSGMSDQHVVVYGHNMLNGSMFGGLKLYREQEYWEEHPYVYITYADGSVETYRIFSCYLTDPNDAVYGTSFTADEYKALVSDMIGRALYNTNIAVPDGAQTLTLSTCANDNTKRFAVNAIRVGD